MCLPCVMIVTISTRIIALPIIHLLSLPLPLTTPAQQLRLQLEVVMIELLYLHLFQLQLLLHYSVVQLQVSHNLVRVTRWWKDGWNCAGRVGGLVGWRLARRVLGGVAETVLDLLWGLLVLLGWDACLFANLVTLCREKLFIQFDFIKATIHPPLIYSLLPLLHLSIPLQLRRKLTLRTSERRLQHHRTANPHLLPIHHSVNPKRKAHLLQHLSHLLLLLHHSSPSRHLPPQLVLMPILRQLLYLLLVKCLVVVAKVKRVERELLCFDIGWWWWWLPCCIVVFGARFLINPWWILL